MSVSRRPPQKFNGRIRFQFALEKVFIREKINDVQKKRWGKILGFPFGFFDTKVVDKKNISASHTANNKPTNVILKLSPLSSIAYTCIWMWLWMWMCMCMCM